jgi:DNA-binding MarR family transcriptional regulator
MIMELGDLFLQVIERYHHILIETEGSESGSTPRFPDITINQYFYLQAIHRNENITLTELARIIGVSKPSATAAITKLINDGFVIRTQSTMDQRKFHLSLSAKGQAVFMHKHRACRQFIKRLELCTTPEEQKILTRAFRIMVDSPLEPGE